MDVGADVRDDIKAWAEKIARRDDLRQAVELSERGNARHAALRSEPAHDRRTRCEKNGKRRERRRARRSRSLQFLSGGGLRAVVGHVLEVIDELEMRVRLRARGRSPRLRLAVSHDLPRERTVHRRRPPSPRWRRTLPPSASRVPPEPLAREGKGPRRPWSVARARRRVRDEDPASTPSPRSRAPPRPRGVPNVSSSPSDVSPSPRAAFVSASEPFANGDSASSGAELRLHAAVQRGDVRSRSFRFRPAAPAARAIAAPYLASSSVCFSCSRSTRSASARHRSASSTARSPSLCTDASISSAMAALRVAAVRICLQARGLLHEAHRLDGTIVPRWRACARVPPRAARRPPRARRPRP